MNLAYVAFSNSFFHPASILGQIQSPQHTQRRTLKKQNYAASKRLYSMNWIIEAHPFSVLSALNLNKYFI